MPNKKLLPNVQRFLEGLKTLMEENGINAIKSNLDNYGENTYQTVEDDYTSTEISIGDEEITVESIDKTMQNYIQPERTPTISMF
jgi:hypothetical protein